ncbi:MAG: two-component response regulator [Labilithrix sp.]|nr:two-component response regulator [Labilithrix sp.]
MLNATGAKTRVLVVEDDPDAREIYLGTLSYAGYHVTTATCVAEAKRAARRHSPRLVVLDSRLPDGRGTDLLKIWKRCPEMSGVPVLMVTAFSGEQDLQAAALAGADAFLVKPCYGSTLTTRLSQFLDASGPTRQVARSRRSQPRVPLTLADRSAEEPGKFHPLGDGKLQARCRSCLRGSPVLGREPEEADKQAVHLGWSLRRDGWSCPVCLERNKTGRASR